MSSVGCLGLVIMWYCTTGVCTRTLAMNFGQTSTPMYRCDKFGTGVCTITSGSDKFHLILNFLLLKSRDRQIKSVPLYSALNSAQITLAIFYLQPNIKKVIN